MKVLFDTNVILDVLLAREPHAAVAAHLLNLVDTHEIEGVICATTATTIHYLATKAVGPRKAKKHLSEILAMFTVAAVDEKVLVEALNLGLPDFEDAVLHQAAVAADCRAIVTRNTKDFTKATISVFAPQELLAVTIATRI